MKSRMINTTNIDTKSLQKAYALFKSDDINNLEVGTPTGSYQIHKYLFDDLYDFVGKIRKHNIAKGGFRFINFLYLKAIKRSLIKDLRLRILLQLQPALADKVDIREVIIRSIEQSYYYETYWKGELYGRK